MIERLFIGMIVHYVLSQVDVDRIRAVRSNESPGYYGDNLPSAVQRHQGNLVSVGDHVPMIIVIIWDEDTGCVNGQVILDGNDSLWVTSRVLAWSNTPGTWHFVE